MHTRSGRALWLVFLLTVSLSACGGMGASMAAATVTATAAPTSSLTPTLTQTPSATRTVTQTRRPTLTNTPASATPTLTTAPPPTSTPASSWNGIPIMPQANPGREEGSGYSYTIKATIKQIQDFYEREMAKLGWHPLATGTGETGSMMLFYQKDGKTIAIGAAPLGDLTLVMIIQS